MKNPLWLLVALLIVLHKPVSAGVVSAMKGADLFDKCRYAEGDFKKLHSEELNNPRL
jgi:hypothetical protein